MASVPETVRKAPRFLTAGKSEMWDLIKYAVLAEKRSFGEPWKDRSYRLDIIKLTLGHIKVAHLLLKDAVIEFFPSHGWFMYSIVL